MSLFKFKEFDIEQSGCAQKVGTDSMVLGAFVDHINPGRILDIGTGNGVLALMMAQKFENAFITGVEIQKGCAEVAQSNFKNSQFHRRLEVVNADVNTFQVSGKFDLIVSNPPFFKNATPSARIDRNVARHQSSLNVKQILNFVSDSLSLNGALWLVLPVESYSIIKEELHGNGLVLTQRIKVFGKPKVHKRDILVLKKTDHSLVTPSVESFTIRSFEGEYTQEYKIKTFDFHYSQL